MNFAGDRRAGGLTVAGDATAPRPFYLRTDGLSKQTVAATRHQANLPAGPIRRQTGPEPYFVAFL